jgi:hypothetical protein
MVLGLPPNNMGAARMNWQVAVRSMYELLKTPGFQPENKGTSWFEFTDHDRAQDWLAARARDIRSVKIMVQTDPIDYLYFVQVGKRLDAIFSSPADADAWLFVNGDHFREEVAGYDEQVYIQTVAVNQPSEPPKPKPTSWERLLDESED